MLDLIIRGGDVVTPQGLARCDLAIKGETIAAVAAPGALAEATATRVIDAAGKVVIPGGVDPHVHMHHPWILPDGTTLLAQCRLYGSGAIELVDDVVELALEAAPDQRASLELARSQRARHAMGAPDGDRSSCSQGGNVNSMELAPRHDGKHN